MNEKTINAVEMTRKIRDNHAKRLAGKSHAERMAFYRERARKMQKKVIALLSVESGDFQYPHKSSAALTVGEKRAAYKTKK
jgi:hypothetical protein